MTPSVQKDLRGTFGPARNQHSRPTCLAFAVSDAHASLRDGWTPLSCEFIFFHAQRRTGRNLTTGATLSGMTEAIKEDGQLVESDWPYSPVTPSNLTGWSPPSGITTVYRRSGTVHKTAFDEILSHLVQDRPVVLAMMLSDGFYAPTDSIVDTRAGEAVMDARRHAVIAVGYGQSATHRAVMIRNSWGPNWGWRGYAWLTERYLQPRLLSFISLEGHANALVDRAAA